MILLIAAVTLFAAIILIIKGWDKIKNTFVAFIPDAKHNKYGRIGYLLALLELFFCIVAFFIVAESFYSEIIHTGLGGFAFFLGISGMVFSLIGLSEAPRKFAIAGLCISLISLIPLIPYLFFTVMESGFVDDLSFFVPVLLIFIATVIAIILRREKNKAGEIGLLLALRGLICIVVFFVVLMFVLIGLLYHRADHNEGLGWLLICLFLGLGGLGFFLGIFGMILSLIGVFKAPRKRAIAGLCISLILISFAVWLLCVAMYE